MRGNLSRGFGKETIGLICSESFECPRDSRYFSVTGEIVKERLLNGHRTQSRQTNPGGQVWHDACVCVSPES